jgi:hypothetical protein
MGKRAVKEKKKKQAVLFVLPYNNNYMHILLLVELDLIFTNHIEIGVLFFSIS